MPTVIGVARDGSADFKSINAALEAVKALAGKEYELLLKSGDDFTADGEFTLESNGKLALYGGNVRPKIHKIDTVHETRDTFKGVHIYGVEVEHGIRLVGDNEDLLLEEVLFTHCELIVQHFTGRSPRNVTVSKGIWTGAYVDTSSYNQNSRPSNIFIAGIDGFVLEDSVLDFGGWHPTEEGAGANMYNHAIYVQYSCKPNTVKLRRNIIARAASHGVHGRPGVEIDDCLLAKNAIALQMGYKGHPLPEGAKGVARRNVVTQGRSMVKGHDSGANRELVTAARWGFHIDQDPGLGEFSYEGNYILWDDDNETDWRTKFDTLVSRPQYFHKDAKIIKNDTVVINNGKTMDDYAKSIGLADFDAFMAAAKSRKVGEWDERLTSVAANAFLIDKVVTAPEPEPKENNVEIQAEAFKAYFESNPLQEGTGSGPVDTATAPDGRVYVGWTQPGEYLEYALDATAATLYDLVLVAGTGRATPQSVGVMVDGVEAGAIPVAKSSWTAFDSAPPVRIGVSSGKHTIRLTFVTGGVNLDKMILTPVESVREVLPAGAVRVEVDGKKLAIWSE